jgi:hypothetical protein
MAAAASTWLNSVGPRFSMKHADSGTPIRVNVDLTTMRHPMSPLSRTAWSKPSQPLAAMPNAVTGPAGYLRPTRVPTGAAVYGAHCTRKTPKRSKSKCRRQNLAPPSVHARCCKCSVSNWHSLPIRCTAAIPSDAMLGELLPYRDGASTPLCDP